MSRGPASAAVAAAEAAFEAGVRAAGEADPLAAVAPLPVALRPFAWEGLASGFVGGGRLDALAALASDPVRAPFVEVGRGVAAGLSGAAVPTGEWAADGHGFGVGYTRGERALCGAYADGAPTPRGWHLRGVGRAAWFWTRGSPTALQGALSVVAPEDIDAILEGVAFAAVFTRSDLASLAAISGRGAEAVARGASRALAARVAATGG